MSRVALITGITGQVGSYLAEFLLGKGYEVHGLIRRSSTFSTGRIEHIYEDPHENGRLKLHYGDLLDGAGLAEVLRRVDPEEVYNLAAQSHVAVSFKQPVYTANVTGLGVLRLLEAVRAYNPHIRFYQQSSSEMYGSMPPPQSEATPFHPRSPYAAAKVFGHRAAVNYREAYGMFVCCGTAFNMESPRRSETFVTRKITRAATRIAEGLQERLWLGNLDACRDWGCAGDYVQAMWLMMQQDQPDDYVLATGESHSVREFAELAFRRCELDWRKHVEHDPSYERPAEVDALCGDGTKIREALGWEPTVKLPELVAMMLDHDWRLARTEAELATMGAA